MVASTLAELYSYLEDPKALKVAILNDSLGCDDLSKIMTESRPEERGKLQIDNTNRFYVAEFCRSWVSKLDPKDPENGIELIWQFLGCNLKTWGQVDVAIRQCMYEAITALIAKDHVCDVKTFRVVTQADYKKFCKIWVKQHIKKDGQTAPMSIYKVLILDPLAHTTFSEFIELTFKFPWKPSDVQPVIELATKNGHTECARWLASLI
jgi:hypothetical protein